MRTKQTIGKTTYKVDNSFYELDENVQARAIKALEFPRRSFASLSDALDEFAKNFRKVSERQKIKFLKDNERGYYQNRQTIESSTVEALAEYIGNRYNIFNYFNKHGKPFDIKLEKVANISEESKSRDIYAMMSVTQYDIVKVSFNIYFKGETIHIENYFIEDASLSMRDVVNFM